MCFYIDLAALAAAVALFVSLFLSLSLRRGRLVAFACFALVLRDCSRVSVCVAVWVCVCVHCLRACVTRMCLCVWNVAVPINQIKQQQQQQC